MRENSRNQLNAVASKGEVGLVRFEIRLLKTDSGIQFVLLFEDLEVNQKC